MKKFLLIVVIAAAFISLAVYAVCVAKPLFNKGLKGSGNLVTRTIDAPAFDGIHASRAVKVVISDKVADKITIEADDNLMDFVTTEVDEGTLKIGIDKSINSISTIHVTVVVPANGKIESLKATSAASIVGTVALAAPEFDLKATSAGSIRAAVKATKCDLETTSAASIEAALDVTECEIDLTSGSSMKISGKAAKCQAKTTSGASLSASKLLVGDYNISATSGSSARVNCTGVLTASASSGASIRYDGECSANISKSSGGSVHKN